LSRVRESDLAAFAHQDLPFDRLVEAVNPARSTAHHPLFQVMLVLQNNARGDAGFPGVEVVEEPFRTGMAKFDLTFILSESSSPGGEPAGIEGGLEYAADLFDHGTAVSLAERLTRVLEAVAADPGVSVSGVDVLSEEERRTLEGFNDTGVVLPELTVAGVFEGHVRRAPDAVAVVFGGERVTYGEL
ncbi:MULTISPECIES: condensation domain-containing protein, partial [unclassified Nocardiopsis]|uniref:condensation domain-containing protein n=1 Tax=unclassified Nocardiopsis TaxID=2649073 RepID=UPI0013590311